MGRAPLPGIDSRDGSMVEDLSVESGRGISRNVKLRWLVKVCIATGQAVCECVCLVGLSV